jgi:hypothetical protein
VLLDGSVLEEEPLVLFRIFKCSFDLKKSQQKRGPSEKRAGNCHVLANSSWEMLLKVVGLPLGNAQRV